MAKTLARKCAHDGRRGDFGDGGSASGKKESGHDVVVIAGRGHEREQVMAGHIVPFSDREEVLRICG